MTKFNNRFGSYFLFIKIAKAKFNSKENYHCLPLFLVRVKYSRASQLNWLLLTQSQKSFFSINLPFVFDSFYCEWIWKMSCGIMLSKIFFMFLDCWQVFKDLSTIQKHKEYLAQHYATAHDHQCLWIGHLYWTIKLSVSHHCILDIVQTKTPN